LQAELGEKRGECISLSNMAQLYYKTDRPDSGLYYCQKAREIVNTMNMPGLQAWIQLQLGDLYRVEAKLDLAAKAYDQGLTITEGLYLPEIRWPIHYGKGKIWQARKDNENAYYSYRAAINAIEEMRGYAVIEEMKSGLVHDRFDAYEAIILLLTDMGRTEEALSFVERSRARNMLDLHGNTKLRDSDPISVPETKKEHELRIRISDLHSLILEETTQEGISERGTSRETYRHALGQAQRQYQRLLSDLKIKNPDYHAMVAIDPPPLSTIQKMLDKQTAILEYFITDEELLIFTITNKQIRVTRVPAGESSIRGRILLFRGTATEDINKQKLSRLNWIKPLNGLYKILIEPVEQKGYLIDIRHLVIVPHGQLHYLPFQTLITHFDLRGDQDLRPYFLIEKFDISYSTSASLLPFYRQKKQDQNHNILLMAPKISQLPESEQEIENIALKFGSGADLFKDDQATESRLKQDGRKYQYLHFATTAHFNLYNPLFSRLDLHNCPREDGSLEVNEIFYLDLQARLTILSACQTALGAGYTTHLPNGEDLVSLTRAFLYAGSSSVIASLWEIADPATAEFMPHFYENEEKYNTATALAETQRAFIRRQSEQGDDMYYHPYYWAPFILVGAWQ